MWWGRGGRPWPEGGSAAHHVPKQAGAEKPPILPPRPRVHACDFMPKCCVAQQPAGAGVRGDASEPGEAGEFF